MILFKCICNWEWAVGKHKVYGPIFRNSDASCAHILSRKDWRIEHPDCHRLYHNSRKGKKK